jgi:nucleotide-binding universal stress UspA family protein
MIRILDPTLGSAPAGPAAPRAARPASLRGATLGLLANGKSNGMALLDRVADYLRERHGVAEVLRVAKTNASAPVSEADAELLAKHCVAVVTAIGD